MSDLTHFFKVGQEVVCLFDGEKHKGTVADAHACYIIVNVPTVSDHCCFDRDMLDMVYPAYNFGFDCVEDAIDHIQRNYKSGNITLEERNRFLKSL